jgi:CheY-like chemotaxis protein
MNTNNINLAHILLVEDNEGDILLTMFLKNTMLIQEISAKNGQEALDFVFQRGIYKRC